MQCEAYHPELRDSSKGYERPCRPGRTRFIAEDEKIWYFQAVRMGTSAVDLKLL